MRNFRIAYIFGSCALFACVLFSFRLTTRNDAVFPGRVSILFPGPDCLHQHLPSSRMYDSSHCHLVDLLTSQVGPAYANAHWQIFCHRRLRCARMYHFFVSTGSFHGWVAVPIYFAIKYLACNVDPLQEGLSSSCRAGLWNSGDVPRFLG